MSYNIDTFETKYVGMTLPLSLNMEEEFPDAYCSDIEVDLEKKTWSYNEDGEGFQMGGSVDLKFGLILERVKCYGEGSGHDYEDVLKPLFEKYKGSMAAISIWEGGDSILKTIIDSGKITEENVELIDLLEVSKNGE